jgi:putative DNA primase/helicase
MPKHLLVDERSSMWVGRLIDAGWRGPIYRKRRNLLGDYFNLYETDRRALCVPCTGWYENVYVLPDTVFGERTDGIVVLQVPMTDNPFLLKGSFNRWKETIGKWASGNSRIVLAISASLASILIYLARQESGGFNFIGDSSIGKTILLMTAASCWGKGTRENGFMVRWRSTTNGLEGIAALHSDAVLCLDEIGEAPGKTIAEASYMLANGSGKIRANQDGSVRRPRSWRLFFLSSGEIGLEQAIIENGGKVRAGQTVRLVDIPSDAGVGLGVFEDIHEHESSSLFADALEKAAAENYGHLSRAFIAQVLDKRAEVSQKLGRGLPPYLEKLCEGKNSGQARRVAGRFHLCAVAGELATEWGLLPWKAEDASRAAKKCFKAWLNYRGGSGAAEETMIMRQVMLFIEQHGSSRFQNLDDPTGKCSNRVGFRERKGGITKYSILPESFRNEVCKGIDPIRAAKVLYQNGLLLKGDSGYQNKIEAPGLERPRCYVIVMKEKNIEDVPGD